MSGNKLVVGYMLCCFLVALIIVPLTLYSYWDRPGENNINIIPNMTLANKIFFSKISFEIEENSDLVEHVIKKRANKGASEKHHKACSTMRSCDKCTSFTQYDCLWCNKGSKCMAYPFHTFVPQTKDCEWTEARWGLCSIDFRAMVIAVGVIGGIILLIVCCCIVKLCRCVTDCCHVCGICCCCTCFKERSERKKELLQLKRLEQKLESQARRQELMLKYGSRRPAGVSFGSTGNYTTFENDSV